MIRVNLISTARKKKSKPLPMYLIYSGFTLVLSLAVFFFINSYMNSRIKAKEKEKAEKTAELKRLDDLIKHVKDFEAKKAELKKRIDVILEIAEKKDMAPKLLDELSKRLTEGIWLDMMKFTGDKVSLAGIGFNNADIVTYVEHLKDTGSYRIYPSSPIFFTEVKLHGTQKVSYKKETVYKFQITMKVNTLKPKEKKGPGNGA